MPQADKERIARIDRADVAYIYIFYVSAIHGLDGNG